MKKRHWRRQIWIGAALTAVIVSVFFWARQEKRENEMVLEDGSVLRYLGATPGRTAYTEENLWHRLARKYLPASLQSGILKPLTISPGRASHNDVSLYFVRGNLTEKNSGSRKPTQSEKDLNPNIVRIISASSWSRRGVWLEAIEEGGFVYRPEGMFPWPSIQRSNDDKLEYYPLFLPNFPRRQRQFPVRLYLADEDDPHASGKGGRLIGTFIAENPFPTTKFPEWTASDLPTTNIVDGVQVVLNEFGYLKRKSYKVIDTRQGLRSWPPWDMNDLPFQSFPYIKVSRVDGKPTTYQNRSPHSYHRAPSHQFFDPTGNKGEACALSPQEPVWKLQLKLYRSRDDAFPVEHRGKFANLPVLGDGEAKLIQKTMEVDGVGFRLLCVSGPGSTTISNHFEDPDNLKIHAEKLEQNKKQELFEKLKDLNHHGFQSDSGQTRRKVPIGQGAWFGSWESAWENWKSNYHLIVVNMVRISGIGEQSGPVEDVEILFRFTDQDGRPIAYPPLVRYTPPRGWIKMDEYFTRYEKNVDRISLGGKRLADYSEHRPFEWNWVFPLELDEETQSVNVECIVNRGLTAEFFLRPEDVLQSLETN